MRSTLNNCSYNLKLIKAFLSKTDPGTYVKKQEILSCSSIGEHMRHLLEFYICLLDRKHPDEVNYDLRERQSALQNYPKMAVKVIDDLLNKLGNQSLVDQSITVFGNYTTDSDEITGTLSSLERELIFCLDHSIHHQALIKIALKVMSLEDMVDSHFGVAPATLRFRSVCVQ